MKNQATGKYESHKYFKRSGHSFVGVGDTQAEANADLKRQLAPYLHTEGAGVTARSAYRLPMEPTGEVLASPGYSKFKTANGGVSYRYNDNRTVAVMAAPHIAKAKREELEAKKAKDKT